MKKPELSLNKGATIGGTDTCSKGANLTTIVQIMSPTTFFSNISGLRRYLRAVIRSKSTRLTTDEFLAAHVMEGVRKARFEYLRDFVYHIEVAFYVMVSAL
jgi:hypothetical protein